MFIVSFFILPRDLREYFLLWPRDPLVRHLYRADLHDAGRWLRDAPLADLALTGRLSLWDTRALEIDAPGRRARWFNPEDALLYPAAQSAPIILFRDPPPSDWARARLKADFTLVAAPASFEIWLPKADRALWPPEQPEAEWTNGLQFVGHQWAGPRTPGAAMEIEIAWRAGPGYAAPPPQIGASPNSPQQPYTSFVHLLSPDGTFVAGYDRFDADAFTLQPGDVVVQHYRLDALSGLAPGQYSLETGFYDPISGARFTTTGGRESYSFANVDVPQ